MRPMRPKIESGFTLVELMVVIVLIGLLAGAVTVGVFGLLQKGKTTIARTRMSTIVGAIGYYKLDYGRAPQDLTELTQTMVGADEPYLSELPLDPWGNDYLYDPTGGTKKAYLITSMGPDLIEGTEDDITSDDSQSGRGDHQNR